MVDGNAEIDEYRMVLDGFDHNIIGFYVHVEDSGA
jgi:hypothetical protein